MVGSDQIDPSGEEQCSRMLRGLLTGEAAADLTDDLADAVVLWSPRLQASCREDLLLSLQDGLVGCDPLSDVEVRVLRIDVSGPRVSLDWQLTGRFTRAHFLDDDLLVEPTKQPVEVQGRLSVIRVDAQIAAITCSFDARGPWQQRTGS